LLGDLRIGDFDAQAGHDPVVEIRDPGIVFENRAAFIEFPKCYLEEGALVNAMITCVC
jgi:hypothetical protein